MAGHHRLTVEELFDRMDREEFYQWMVLERIEPFGEYGDYFRAGIVASTIANVNRGKDQKAFTPHDFMPNFDMVKQQGPQDFFAALMALKKGQDAILRSKAKLDKSNGDSIRSRQTGKQTKRASLNGPKKDPH